MGNLHITKEFSFEMAHMLDGYDGRCRNIHGHSYRLFVTISGNPCIDASSPAFGMVMDFGELKRIVNEEIINKFDHAIVVRDGIEQAEQLSHLTERFYALPYRPTTENMICDFAQRISNRLPKNVALFSLRLHETATSYVEWFAEN